MGFCLVFLALCLPSYAVCRASGKKFIESMCGVMLCISITSFVFSMFSALVVPVVLLWAVCIFSAVYCIWDIVKSKQLKLDYTLLVAVVIFLILWWINRGRKYIHWDEFSHWGLAVKSLFVQGRLVGLLKNTSDNFGSYPPTIAPFIYTCMRAVRLPFREDYTLFLQGLFTACLAVYPICKSRGRAADGAVWAVVYFLLPLTMYTYVYQTVQADCLMAVVCAFVFVVALYDDGSMFDLSLACMGAGLLSGCMKTTGIILATFFSVCWALTNKKSNRIRQFAPAVVTVVAYYSWKIFVSVNHVAVRWSENTFSLGLLADVLRGGGGYRTQVLHDFIKEVFGHGAYGMPVAVSMFAILLVLTAVFYLFCDENHTRGKIVFNTAFLLAVSFVFSLLWGYLFIFSEGEATVLASITRYANSVLTSLYVLTLCAVMNSEKTGRIPSSVLGLFLMVVLAQNSPAVLTGYIKDSKNNAYISINRTRPHNAIASYIQASDRLTRDNTCVITQTDTGLDVLKIDYALFPEKMGPQVPAVTVIDQNVIENMVLYPSPRRWLEDMDEKYDYIILHVITRFEDEFEAVFEDYTQMAVGSVLEITTGEDGHKFLRQIDKIEW